MEMTSRPAAASSARSSSSPVVHRNCRHGVPEDHRDAADADTLQAVHHAALHGRIDVLTALLDAGADLHAATNARAGHTVLTCAIETRTGKKALEVVNVLAERGVDVNQPAAEIFWPVAFDLATRPVRVHNELAMTIPAAQVWAWLIRALPA